VGDECVWCTEQVKDDRTTMFPVSLAELRKQQQEADEANTTSTAEGATTVVVQLAGSDQRRRLLDSHADAHTRQWSEADLARLPRQPSVNLAAIRLAIANRNLSDHDKDKNKDMKLSKPSNNSNDGNGESKGMVVSNEEVSASRLASMFGEGSVSALSSGNSIICLEAIPLLSPNFGYHGSDGRGRGAVTTSAVSVDGIPTTRYSHHHSITKGARFGTIIKPSRPLTQRNVVKRIQSIVQPTPPSVPSSSSSPTSLPIDALSTLLPSSSDALINVTSLPSLASSSYSSNAPIISSPVVVLTPPPAPSLANNNYDITTTATATATVATVSDSSTSSFGASISNSNFNDAFADVPVPSLIGTSVPYQVDPFSVFGSPPTPSSSSSSSTTTSYVEVTSSLSSSVAPPPAPSVASTSLLPVEQQSSAIAHTVGADDNENKENNGVGSGDVAVDVVDGAAHYNDNDPAIDAIDIGGVIPSSPSLPLSLPVVAATSSIASVDDSTAAISVPFVSASMAAVASVAPVTSVGSFVTVIPSTELSVLSDPLPLITPFDINANNNELLPPSVVTSASSVAPESSSSLPSGVNPAVTASTAALTDLSQF
jgi:hypothetical protein